MASTVLTKHTSDASDHRHFRSLETHAGGSVSYGLISASVSAGHSQTHSGDESDLMMSRCQFNTCSAHVKAEKHGLTRSRSNSKYTEIVRQNVSDEICRMHDKCVRFRGSQTLFHDGMLENGMLGVPRLQVCTWAKLLLQLIGFHHKIVIGRPLFDHGAWSVLQHCLHKKQFV